MNIWDQVEYLPNADYMDQRTGNIYLIQEYTKSKRLDMPTPCEQETGRDGLRVMDSGGNPVGYVYK